MSLEALKKSIKENIDNCTDKKRLELALACIAEYEKNSAIKEQIDKIKIQKT